MGAGTTLTRVVVTQASPGARRTVKRLRGEGIDAVACPLIRTAAVEGGPIRAEGYDWLVLTSGVGVEELFRRLQGELPRVAVVGRGTAEALRRHGIEPALVATVSTQEGLVAALPKPAGRVLFAAAEGARRVIVRELAAEFVALYRTIELRPERFPEADLVVLASGSAARSFAALARDLPCVSIGPQTSAEARRQGLRVVGEAESHDADGLVQAVKLAASGIASSRS